MLTRLMSKIADLSKKGAIVYILTLVFMYLAGMVLVICGVVLIDQGQFINPYYFYPGIDLWIPTLIMTILTALSSNYTKEIKEEDEKIKEMMKRR